MRCKRGFPKTFPRKPDGTPDLKSRVTVDFGNLLKYHPARDDCYVNNYNPVFLHAWGANMDMQLMDNHNYAVAVYVTSYLSKVDKLDRCSWTQMVREFEEEIRGTITSSIAEGMHNPVNSL
jgi:hypothetical protein